MAAPTAGPGWLDSGSVAVGVPAPGASRGRAGDARGAPLGRAGDVGPRRRVAGEARGRARTRVPRSLGVAAHWRRPTRRLPAPPLRTLSPLPGPPASGDWPASPTNGGPPAPASRAPGRRGQWQRGGRGAPSPRGPGPRPRPHATGARSTAPLLPAGPRAAAAPPRRLGASQLRSASTPRHPPRRSGRRRGRETTPAPPGRLTHRCVWLFPGPGPTRPDAALESRVQPPGPRAGTGRPATCPVLPPLAAAPSVGLTSTWVQLPEPSKFLARFVLTQSKLKMRCGRNWESTVAKPAAFRVLFWIRTSYLPFTSLFPGSSASPKVQVAVTLLVWGFVRLFLIRGLPE